MCVISVVQVLIKTTFKSIFLKRVEAGLIILINSHLLDAHKLRGSGTVII